MTLLIDAAPSPAQTLIRQPISAEHCLADPACQARRRKPLLRTNRVQICLKALSLYSGKINGRKTYTTFSAIDRFNNRYDLDQKNDDPLKDRAVQNKLGAVCREPLDAYDKALRDLTKAAQAPASEKRLGADETSLLANGQGVSGQSSNDMGASGPRASTGPDRNLATRAQAPAVSQPVCLPPDLRRVLQRVRPSRRDVTTCDLPCLRPPTDLKPNDVRDYQLRDGIQWCASCIPFSSYLPLDDIERIEAAGRIVLCREVPKTAAALEQRSVAFGAPSRNMRTLLGKRAAAPPHNNVAVVIGNRRYSDAGPQGLPAAAAHAHRDTAAVSVLLTERLGFASRNMIEINDATRADFERIFGTPDQPRGELWERLNGRRSAGSGASVFIYVSGLGAMRTDNGQALLIPADGSMRQEQVNNYPLEIMMTNLPRLGASSVAVFLEVDFGHDPNRLLLAPNLPESETGIPLGQIHSGIMLMTAADRDQRTLTDLDYGLGLFTRYLIEGLSGAADAPPIGNGDQVVDTGELYVYAALKVGIAARKSFGVVQKPVLRQTLGHAVVRFNASGN